MVWGDVGSLEAAFLDLDFEALEPLPAWPACSSVSVSMGSAGAAATLEDAARFLGAIITD